MTELPEARVVRDDTKAASRAAGLGVPPRDVPLDVTCRLFFGGAFATFGWLFAAFGMIFVLLFLPKAELWTPAFDREAVATVLRIEATSASENDQRIYRVHYAFTDERGQSHVGSSYTRTPEAMGAARRVEYVAADPTRSRLDGTRTQPFGWLVIMVLIFPIVGVAIAVPQLRAGLLARRLLRHGIVTHGTLIKKEATKTSINDQPIMALTFEYAIAPGAATHQVVIKALATEKLEDDPLEPMLYDPVDPARATTLDHLPGSPRIADDGRLETRAGFGILRLILPMLFVAELVVGLTLWLAG